MQLSNAKRRKVGKVQREYLYYWGQLIPLANYPLSDFVMGRILHVKKLLVFAEADGYIFLTWCFKFSSFEKNHLLYNLILAILIFRSICYQLILRHF